MQSEALAGRRDVQVTQAVLGNDAGILGAAALAFDEHDAREGLAPLSPDAPPGGAPGVTARRAARHAASRGRGRRG